MKTKHIIIILVVLSAIGGGLFFIQNKKQKKALSSHYKTQFQQLKEAGKKSNMSGMLLMASTINKFKKENGVFPGSLHDLYPNYIPDKPFITTMNWQYTQGKGTYLLKRSLEGQTTFASMGPDLKLKMGHTSKTTAVASYADGSKAKKQIPVKNTVSTSTKPVVPVKTNLAQPNMLALKTDRSNMQKTEESKDKSQPELSIIMQRKELAEDEKFLLALDSRSLYIWKTKEGFIGFSNIQYPEIDQLTIYRDKSWVEYRLNQKTKK